MEDEQSDFGWREKLRDELLPYVTFYGIGLLWLAVSNSIAVWSDLAGIVLFAATAIVGGTVTAMVTLLLLWRTLMFGIEVGRVLPMVSAAGASMTVLMIAIGAAFPMIALGRTIGEIQTSVAFDINAMIQRSPG